MRFGLYLAGNAAILAHEKGEPGIGNVARDDYRLAAKVSAGGEAKERMKKRFRKKRRIGEYTEWGRGIAIERRTESGFDEFLDTFIKEAVESNGCFCGGGGQGGGWSSLSS